MPDRYGEIDACDLCDERGQRNGFPCDHQDWASAAKRGMALIRAAMGWRNA